MSLEVFLLIVAAVLALPGGLFATYIISSPRARWASAIGGILGDGLVALGVWYYVQAAHVGIDGLSFWFGSLFACSIGVVIGALVVNFLVGLARRGPDISSFEA